MANGTAYLTYQLPSHWGGLLYAYYAGSKSYAASNVTGAIQYSSPASGVAASPYVSGQGNFIDLRVVGIPAISAEVVMGIFILVNCYSFRSNSVRVDKSFRNKKEEGG